MDTREGERRRQTRDSSHLQDAFPQSIFQEESLSSICVSHRFSPRRGKNNKIRSNDDFVVQDDLDSEELNILRVLTLFKVCKNVMNSITFSF